MKILSEQNSANCNGWDKTAVVGEEKAEVGVEIKAVLTD